MNILLKGDIMKSIPKEENGKIIFAKVDLSKMKKEIKTKKTFTREEYADILAVLKNQQSRVSYYYDSKDVGKKLSRTWIGYAPDDKEMSNLIDATENTLQELLDGLKTSEKFDSSESVQQKISNSLIEFINKQRTLNKSTDFLIDALDIFENTIRTNKTLKDMNNDGKTAQKIYTSFCKNVESTNDSANNLSQEFSQAIDLGLPLA